MPVPNLRVHVYGVQGSGSVFPSRDERLDYQRQSEIDLLTLVFDDFTNSVQHVR